MYYNYLASYTSFVKKKRKKSCITDLGYWVSLIMCCDHYYGIISEVRKTRPLLVISQCLKCVSLILKWGFIVKKAIQFSFVAVEDIVNSISAG